MKGGEVIIPLRQAFADKRYLGSQFEGPSWDGWKIIAMALRGELTDAELARFQELTGRTKPPSRQVRRFLARVGRRGGKDQIASALATHAAAMIDWRGVLAGGEVGTVLVLAKDKQQAGGLFKRISCYFDLPAFKSLVKRRTLDTIELINSIDIVVRANDAAAIRGLTIVCCIFNECAHWEDAEHFANPLTEVVRAVEPSIMTTGGQLIFISTPWTNDGLFAELCNRYEGVDDDDNLAIHGATETLNPTLVSDEFIAELKEVDPVSWRSEIQAEYRDAHGQYIPRELLNELRDTGIVYRAPDMNAPWLYVAFADCATGMGGDSYAACVSHYEPDRGKVVLDAIFEAKPPFDAWNVVGQICQFVQPFRVTKIYGDRHSIGFNATAFMRHGVEYVAEGVPRKSDLYLQLLPMLTSRSVRLLDDDRLVDQLCSLQRIALPSGLERIDAHAGRPEDVANATCGALIYAAQQENGADIWLRLAKSNCVEDLCMHYYGLYAGFLR
jgi:hypothetical protein